MSLFRAGFGVLVVSCSLLSLGAAALAEDRLSEDGDPGDPLPADWVPELVALAPGESAKIVTSETARWFRRSFRLHVPAGYDESKSYPLVVALHGGMATARIFEDQSHLSVLADRHGFFVVYPNGFGIFSLVRHWNGGYCCGRARWMGLDDPGFVDRVRSWVSERYPIDPERHYVVGYSNGGMLAYWYAGTRADELAGLAIWASSIGQGRRWQMPWPDVALPAIIAHGTADPKLPFEVAEGADDSGGTFGKSELLGALGSARAWAVANGCSDEPTTRGSWDGSTLQATAWCSGEGRREVRFLALEGWDHDWPGPRFTERLPEQDPLHGFDLAEEIWRFFDSLEG